MGLSRGGAKGERTFRQILKARRAIIIMDSLLNIAISGGAEKIGIDLLGETAREMSPQEALGVVQMLIRAIHSSEPELFDSSAKTVCLDFQTNGCKSQEPPIQLIFAAPKSRNENSVLHLPRPRPE